MEPRPDSSEKDVGKLCEVLHWVTKHEIKNFLRSVPLKHTKMRCRLALQHFFNLRDKEKCDFYLQINENLRKILELLPNEKYNMVTKNLIALGNNEDAVEIMLRLLVNGSIGEKVPANDSSSVNGLEDEPTGSTSTEHADIGVVVPSTSGETTPSIENGETHYADSGETIILDDSHDIGLNNSVISLNDANTEAVAGEDEAVSSKKEYFAVKETVPEPQTNADGDNELGAQIDLGVELQNQEEIMAVDNHEAAGPSGVANVANEELGAAALFDLSAYIYEFTRAPKPTISNLIQQMNLDVTQIPDENTLNYLVTMLLVEDLADQDAVMALAQEIPQNQTEGKCRNEGDMDKNIEDHLKGAKRKRKVTEKITEKSIFPFVIEQMDVATAPQNTTAPVRVPEPNIPLNEVANETEVSKVLNEPHVDSEDAVAGPSRENVAGGAPNTQPGCSKEKKAKLVDEKLVVKLLQVFPDATPEYVRELCVGRKWSEGEFDVVASIILDTGGEYPRRPQREPSPDTVMLDADEQWEMLKQILPDADPTFLRMRCEELIHSSELMKQFIENALEKHDYPTMKEYLRKQQLSAQQKQYTTEFNIENFVQLFPDPEATFNDPTRKPTLFDNTTSYYLRCFLRNRFSTLPVSTITTIMQKYKHKLSECFQHLTDCEINANSYGRLRNRRKPGPVPDTSNIPFLQELAYLSHRDEILRYIETQKKRQQKEREDCIKNGLIDTCSCCYDEQVMLKDIFTCGGGCKFCKDCIQKSTEIAVGEGKTEFPCLMGCSAEFSLQVLQQVLPPKMFSNLAQKKAVAEVAAAGIPGLAQCPFCHFATILPAEDKIFKCLNPDCMKESCRLCKEPSHIPLKCEEVEKDAEVKARTYIEDKMTEALIRECWKCKAKFFKTEGCNKMTCQCGAQMCYICRKPVTDYKHFNGMGGDQKHLCPLYTDNFSVNEQNVIKAAEAAKNDVDVTKLKHDPTADLQQLRAKHKTPRRNHVAEPCRAPGHIVDYNTREGQRRLHYVQLAEELFDRIDIARHPRLNFELRRCFNRVIPTALRLAARGYDAGVIIRRLISEGFASGLILASAPFRERLATLTLKAGPELCDAALPDYALALRRAFRAAHIPENYGFRKAQPWRAPGHIVDYNTREGQRRLYCVQLAEEFFDRIHIARDPLLNGELRRCFNREISISLRLVTGGHDAGLIIRRLMSKGFVDALHLASAPFRERLATLTLEAAPEPHDAALPDYALLLRRAFRATHIPEKYGFRKVQMEIEITANSDRFKAVHNFELNLLCGIRLAVLVMKGIKVDLKAKDAEQPVAPNETTRVAIRPATVASTVTINKTAPSSVAIRPAAIASTSPINKTTSSVAIRPTTRVSSAAINKTTPSVAIRPATIASTAPINKTTPSVAIEPAARNFCISLRALGYRKEELSHLAGVINECIRNRQCKEYDQSQARSTATVASTEPINKTTPSSVVIRVVTVASTAPISKATPSSVAVKPATTSPVAFVSVAREFLNSLRDIGCRKEDLRHLTRVINEGVRNIQCKANDQSQARSTATVASTEPINKTTPSSVGIRPTMVAGTAPINKTTPSPVTIESIRNFFKVPLNTRRSYLPVYENNNSGPTATSNSNQVISNANNIVAGGGTATGFFSPSPAMVAGTAPINKTTPSPVTIESIRNFFKVPLNTRRSYLPVYENNNSEPTATSNRNQVISNANNIVATGFFSPTSTVTSSQVQETCKDDELLQARQKINSTISKAPDGTSVASSINKTNNSKCPAVASYLSSRATVPSSQALKVDNINAATQLPSSTVTSQNRAYEAQTTLDNLRTPSVGDVSTRATITASTDNNTNLRYTKIVGPVPSMTSRKTFMTEAIEASAPNATNLGIPSISSIYSSQLPTDITSRKALITDNSKPEVTQASETSTFSPNATDSSLLANSSFYSSQLPTDITGRKALITDNSKPKLTQVSETSTFAPNATDSGLLSINSFYSSQLPTDITSGKALITENSKPKVTQASETSTFAPNATDSGLLSNSFYSSQLPTDITSGKALITDNFKPKVTQASETSTFGPNATDSGLLSTNSFYSSQIPIGSIASTSKARSTCNLLASTVSNVASNSARSNTFVDSSISKAASTIKSTAMKASDIASGSKLSTGVTRKDILDMLGDTNDSSLPNPEEENLIMNEMADQFHENDMEMDELMAEAIQYELTLSIRPTRRDILDMLGDTNDASFPNMEKENLIMNDVAHQFHENEMKMDEVTAEAIESDHFDYYARHHRYDSDSDQVDVDCDGYEGDAYDNGNAAEDEADVFYDCNESDKNIHPNHYYFPVPPRPYMQRVVRAPHRNVRRGHADMMVADVNNLLVEAEREFRLELARAGGVIGRQPPVAQGPRQLPDEFAIAQERDGAAGVNRRGTRGNN